MIANQSRHIKISRYNGNIQLVNKIRNLIEKNYSNLFYAVIVHGSIATDEVIKYSDFDGLLIVKDSYVKSNQLKRFKRESLKLILKFDPLQHHGWFQITKSQLSNYPENYLPLVILEKAKLIYHESLIENIDVIITSEINYKSFLLKMIEQFERRIETGWRPKNLFQLKSVLSQIMLMPSLYYSAINNKGIFKKESFDAVRTHFSAIEWMPIETASYIRTKWNYKLNGVQTFMLRIPDTRTRKMARLIFSPKINSEFDTLLNDEFYLNLKSLIQKIKSDIL